MPDPNAAGVSRLVWQLKACTSGAASHSFLLVSDFLAHCALRCIDFSPMMLEVLLYIPLNLLSHVFGGSNDLPSHFFPIDAGVKLFVHKAHNCNIIASHKV